jgi:glycosyltransferase involved in cell wall biosynthesis
MQTMMSGPVVLSFARFLPHERLDRLIEAYHVLISHHRPDVRLIIVGAAQDPEYAEAVRRQVRELNLHGVWLRGHASDDELVAFLRHADLFATMSEQEGFCVPVVEAFAFGVPVLAARAGAMPGTVADAALLLAPGDGAAVAAEAMAEILTNDTLRDRLVARGRARAELLAPHNTTRRRVQILSAVT